jgi:hypothetical protein
VRAVLKAMPKILYFVPEDGAFVSHFRPMAEAAGARHTPASACYVGLNFPIARM